MAWGLASIDPTREVLRSTIDPLSDFPANASSTEGAKEVAQLAAFRAVQEFAFEPIMDALNKLRTRKWDPEQPFLIADSVKFDWRTAPIRKYNSFEDFYHRELEATWGKWTDLQETYHLRISGQISEGEAQERVRNARAAAMRAADEEDREKQRPAGRPKTVDSSEIDIHNFSPRAVHPAAENGLVRPAGTSADAALRRLRKDRPDLHARVLDGELSAHAAMIEAGFRKPGKSRRIPTLDKILKLVPLLTNSERVRLIEYLGQ